MSIILGMLIGFGAWFVLRYVLTSFYTVDQNERAVKTSFGRAERVGNAMTIDTPLAETLTEEHKQRYNYPQVRVIQPGGPYFKWPWERVYKVSIATQTINMAQDPEDPKANAGGTYLEGVTKDQLNTGLTGQIRYRVAENNLYAYLFGVKRPISHVMGYFVSVLRERIASFEAPQPDAARGGEMSIVTGVSINDLRKNLRDLNEHMERECASSAARYGIILDIAQKVYQGRPIDLAMGHVNQIWQGDANACLARSFPLCSVPARVINLTGTEVLRVRDIAGVGERERAGAVQRRLRLGEAGGRQVQQPEPPAIARQLGGDRAPETARGTGDEGALCGKAPGQYRGGL